MTKRPDRPGTECKGVILLSSYVKEIPGRFKSSRHTNIEVSSNLFYVY